MRGGIRIVGLAVGALIAAASLALAGGGGYEVKSKSETINPSTSGGITMKCPQDSAVVGGGYFLDGGVSRRIVGSFPLTRRKFVVTGSNTDGSGTFDLVGAAVCENHGQVGISDNSVDVVSGDFKTVKARCPEDTTVSGGGFKSSGDVFVGSSYPKGSRKWIVRGQNGGLDTSPMVAYAICDLDGSAYSIESRTKMPPPLRKPRGVNADVKLNPKCKGGLEPSGGGFKRVGVGSGRATRSFPDGDSWSVEFATYTGKSLELTAYAVCGSG
jgi:hypothetical protein